MPAGRLEPTGTYRALLSCACFFGFRFALDRRFLQFFETVQDKLDQLVRVVHRLGCGANRQAQVFVNTGEGDIQAPTGRNDGQALEGHHWRSPHIQLLLGADHVGNDQIGTR